MKTYHIEPPEIEHELELNEESVLVELEPGNCTRFVLHDYARLFAHPGLFEDIFVRYLSSNSHNIICDTFLNLLRERGVDPRTLNVVELGAGNGVTAECFLNAGFKSVIGLDSLQAAKEAALRDRPHVYTTYLCGDILNLLLSSESISGPIDVILTVAAIGMGHIDAPRLKAAFGVLRSGGHFVFNIYSRLINQSPPSDFDRLLSEIQNSSSLLYTQQYRHRFSVDGHEVLYTIFVFEKHRNQLRPT